MDYFFLSAEDQKASQNPIIVMIDEVSGNVYARGAGRKGAVDADWLIEDMSAEMKSWGHIGGPRELRQFVSNSANGVLRG